jgi:adenylyltransferase/sulfurtransferase
MATDMDLQRYHRQILFDGIGESGQKKLLATRVVQVGCGGLGSTLAACMIRAGILNLTLIDTDFVDITNLHRQFLFDETDVEKNSNKAKAAAKKLASVNSNARPRAFTERLEAATADKLLSGHDLVLDGTDNMETRYVINDWCVKNNIPWIYGGVAGSSGMTMNIFPAKGPCLRCLFPDKKDAPGREEIKTAGMINTIPALIACIQSTEAQKIMIGSPDVISGLRIIDLWSGDFQTIAIEKNPDCPCCGKRNLSNK